MVKNMINRGSDFLLPVMGILPLLVVANSFESALAIGTINLLALVSTGLIISVLRNLLPVAIRMVAVLLVSSCVVMLLQTGLQLRFYELSQSLGIYLPLIAVNCLVLSLPEECTSTESVVKSFLSMFVTGLCILAIVVVAGLIREYAGLAVLRQPTGVFLMLAFLTALYRYITDLQIKSA